MKNAVLITLIKAPGRKSSRGFEYNFALNIKVDYLEDKSFSIDQNGMFQYSYASMCCYNYGYLSQDEGRCLKTGSIYCLVQLPHGRIYHHLNIFFNDFSINELISMTVDALRSDLITAFDKAEYGSMLETTPIDIFTLRSEGKLTFNANKKPFIPPEDDHRFYEYTRIQNQIQNNSFFKTLFGNNPTSENNQKTDEFNLKF